MEQYSPEFVAILGVGVVVLAAGVAVAGLILQQARRLDSQTLTARMDEQDRRTDDRFRQLTEQMNERFRQMDEQTNERFRQLTKQLTEQHRQLTEQMNEQMNERFRKMDERFQNLSDRVARVEGKLDLLGTFITRRNQAPAKAAE